MNIENKAYGQQILGLIRKLTESDGNVTKKERSWLRLLQNEFGAKNAPNVEFDEAALKAIIKNKDEAEDLVQLLLMVSLSDGQTTPKEWELIQKIGSMVEISPEHLEKLRSETILVVDP